MTDITDDVADAIMAGVHERIKRDADGLGYIRALREVVTWCEAHPHRAYQPLIRFLRGRLRRLTTGHTTKQIH